MSELREYLKDKKRIVVKIGSSSLQHKETGDMDYIRLEKLVRELSDIRNQGKEVILVTSGAIAAGKKAVGIKEIKNEGRRVLFGNEKNIYDLQGRRLARPAKGINIVDGQKLIVK